MSSLTFSFVIIITLNWQFKRSKQKLDLKNSAGLGTMRQGVQQYGIFAKYATWDASVTITTFKMSRGGERCDLPFNGRNLLGCCPLARRNAIRSDKSRDGFQPRARRVHGRKGQERKHSEAKGCQAETHSDTNFSGNQEYSWSGD